MSIFSKNKNDPKCQERRKVKNVQILSTQFLNAPSRFDLVASSKWNQQLATRKAVLALHFSTSARLLCLWCNSKKGQKRYTQLLLCKKSKLKVENRLLFFSLVFFLVLKTNLYVAYISKVNSTVLAIENKIMLYLCSKSALFKKV